MLQLSAFGVTTRSRGTMQQVTIVEVDKPDGRFTSNAVELLDATQGKGVFSVDDLERIITNRNAIMLAARIETELVSVSWARKLSEDFAYYAPFGEEATTLLADHEVGSLESSSVTPARQRQGIGGRMLRRRVSWLAEAGCSLAVAVSWRNGQVNTSESLFEAAGFTAHGQAENFYLETSRARGYVCPYCDDGCRCGAVFFARVLGGSPPDTATDDRRVGPSCPFTPSLASAALFKTTVRSVDHSRAIV